MKGKKWLIIVIAVLNVLLIAAVVFLWMRTDRKAPVIEFGANDTVYTPGMDYEPLYVGASAYDAKDGDVTGRIVIEKVVEDEATGSVTVTYAASDLSGNVAKMSRVFAADYRTSESDADESADKQTEEADTQDSAGETPSDAPGEEADAGSGDTAEGENTEAESEEKEEVILEEVKETETAEAEVTEEPRKLTLDDLTEEERKALKDEARAEAAAQAERQQRRAEAAAAKAAAQAQSEAAANSGKPVIKLKNTSIKTIPGQTPMWVDAIGGLLDDKDSYAQLFSTLKYTKYDINTAGTYSVALTVTDSDKNVSDPVYVSVVVK